jgi:hypothetical protein
MGEYTDGKMDGWIDRWIFRWMEEEGGMDG